MKSFFENLFGKKQVPRNDEDRGKAVRRNGPPHQAAELYRKGDVIGGKYEVQGTLGKGGFGVVYLAYDRDTKEACALKTFRDDLLSDAAALEAFKKEALLWVELERHPFILSARWVVVVSARLFVEMEHVAPDAHGRVSLADHLAQAGGPLDADQTLMWAVQFCHGMEHAHMRGIKCHRDIKPANILITQDGTLKISDFGLAAAAETAWRAAGRREDSLIAGGAEGAFGLSLVQTAGITRCGTPGYLAPEVYRGEGADTRSDLYSFGLVLWQMATGSRVPPFSGPYQGDLERWLREIYVQQMTARAPHVEDSLSPVIERCLRPTPADRYGTFAELREALEPILERKTGKRLEVPRRGEKTAAFWNEKGGSLVALGRCEEAIACFDQALAISPRDATPWNNKGAALADLGRHEEAIRCYDQTLVIDPRDASAWYNKGNSLTDLGQGEEALACYEEALTIDARHAAAWHNKGTALADLGRREEAIACFDQALTIDPKDAKTWHCKGKALAGFGRREQAIACFDHALAIDPRDARAWINKGKALADLGRRKEAIACFDQALAIDSRDARAWINRGGAEEVLGHRSEAMMCYRKFIELAPPQHAQFVARVRQRLRELKS